MSALPSDTAELDALAAEYVLGTLDARMSAQVEAALSTDVGLAAMVGEWEAYFAPLTALARPEAPPADLWSRIERRILPAPAPNAVRPRFARLWQGWAIGASLAVIAMAAFMIVPKPPEQHIMTVLVSDVNQTAWTAEVDSRGGIQLAALPAAGGAANNTAPDGGKVLQLWGLPPGGKAPTSLGLVPRGAGSVSIPTPAVRPVAGMLIMISLEPPGGAPGNAPTGPVMFIGRLTEAGPPT